jgi:hypothetical protein
LFESAMRAQVEVWVDDIVRTLTRLDGDVRAGGGRLVVVVIPDQLQIDPAIRAQVIGLGARTYDFDWLQPALLQRLTAAGIATVDLLPAFRAASSTPRLYRRRDTHWSAAGNALAAQHIAAFLAGS